MSHADEGPSAGSDVSRQVRGSTGLLAGRGISLLVNLGTKVIIVRWLTKSEFGAFAYGFAMVPVVRTMVAMGQTQSISRFLALYEEERRDGAFLGAIVTVVLVVMALGTAVVAVLVAVRDTTVLSLVGDPTAAMALTIVVALGPIDALDKVWEAVLAVVARPAEIFVRRYVIGPVMLVAAITVTLLAGGQAVALAYAFVAAGLATTLVSAALAVRAMRRSGALRRAREQGLSYPVGELYRFSSPLVMTELLPIALGPVAVGILGIVGTTEDIASYRAVFPLARFNQSVIFTFTILYVPLASRLFARRDRIGAADAYWQTASWLLLLSVPAMIATIAFAEPVTVLLFGEVYRSSALVLAVLSLGYFANVSTGFNAQTLQVHGHVGYLVASSLLAAGASVAAMLLLARPFGAVGIAVGVGVGLAVQNGLNHYGLARRTRIPAIPRSYASLLGRVLSVLGALSAWQWIVGPPVWLGLGVGGVAAVVLLVASRRGLRIGETFPELHRVPLVRRVVG